jgi:hypothetical protein
MFTSNQIRNSLYTKATKTDSPPFCRLHQLGLLKGSKFIGFFESISDLNLKIKQTTAGLEKENLNLHGWPSVSINIEEFTLPRLLEKLTFT